MTKEFKISNLAEIDKVAADFVDYVSASTSQSNIIAFYGAMGGGKTTFIKAICKVLGVKDVVNSPTFTIVNQYQSSRGFPIFHFDFYRIKNIAEAYDIGVEEYFGSEGLSLIEWSEKIEPILPDDVIRVAISVNPDMSRSIKVDL